VRCAPHATGAEHLSAAGRSPSTAAADVAGWGDRIGRERGTRTTSSLARNHSHSLRRRSPENAPAAAHISVSSTPVHHVHHRRNFTIIIYFFFAVSRVFEISLKRYTASQILFCFFFFTIFSAPYRYARTLTSPLSTVLALCT